MLIFQKKKQIRLAVVWMLILMMATSCGWIDEEESDGFLVSENNETEAEKVIQVRDGKVYGFLNHEKQKNTWFEVDGATYYLDTKGAAVVGSCQIEGRYYIFLEDGRLFTPSQKQIKKINDTVYMAKPTGVAAKGWNSKKTYYFDKTGTAMTGPVVVDGEFYYFFRNSSRISKKRTKALQEAAVYEKEFRELKALIGEPESADYYDGSYYSGPNGDMAGGWDGILKYKGFTVHTYLAPDGRTEYYMGAEYTAASASVDKLETMVDVIISQQVVSEDRENTKLEKLYAYMVTGNTFGYSRNTTYEEDKVNQKWPKSYALNMVESKMGSSYAYASLYGFLAKKITGYPVRVGVGQTIGFGETPQPHAWMEIKMDGVWYICDPNLDKYAADGSMVYFLKRKRSKAMKALYDNYTGAEYTWVRF